MLADLDLKLEQRLHDADEIDARLSKLRERRLDANGDYAGLVDESVALVARRQLLQGDIDDLLGRREVAFVQRLRQRAEESRAAYATLVTEQLHPRTSERDAIDHELRVMLNKGVSDPARREALMTRRAALQSQLIEVAREVTIAGNVVKRREASLEEAERDLNLHQAREKVREA